jgi:ubiquitin-protein ligase E3 A
MELAVQDAVRECLAEAFLHRSAEIRVCPWFTMHVRREHILEDAVRELRSRPPSHYRRTLKVVFDGEDALDVGGPSREFLYLVCGQLMAPEAGLFRIVEGKYLWFDSGGAADPAMAVLSGAVTGLGIHNSIVLPVRFPLVLYKKLQCPTRPLTPTDLAQVDREAAESLREIERMAFRRDNIEALALTFSTTIMEDGRPKTIPLVNGGASIRVTLDNCQEYIHAYLNYVLFTSVQPLFDAFAKGFRFAIQAPSYDLLDPSELDLLASGDEVLDWSLLPAVTDYENGYDRDSCAIRWFWEIFQSMTEHEKRQLLKFSTGTDCAPFGGLERLKLSIQRSGSTQHLPTAHTCFNCLCLPDYPDKGTMEAKLRLALECGEGFALK